MTRLSPEVRQYLVVTGNYWAFTLTDGALRMLVVLYFHQLGYAPLQVAMLFVFYELFGVVTNLVGGWLGARIGLNRTMTIGLGLQVIALMMLAVPAAWLAVPWVMASQALVGHRQGPQQDERQEQHQAAGAGRPAARALSLGRGADRVQERAQGHRLLPRRRVARAGRLQRRRWPGWRRRWRWCGC